ncbi:ATP-dependent helicase [Vibrio fluvialis]|uniref:UvrD-helicase domain-containing protein n=1 Tax=Vibrio fluvialis TaxID=676 RepID=UPI001EE9CE3E|nr:ATP-dependent helicase [Vibrio fluvialis]MCG6371095.1 ATP-dependent helicase [Vibrio fluvialis]
MSVSKMLEEEKIVQEKIFKEIDSNNSFYFLAGAGSGKTYALVETIKYSLKRLSRSFDISGSRIACITYTNSAKNEILERLYNSSYVEVSTIHSFLWKTIEPYSEELIEIHRLNLNEIKEKINQELESKNTNAHKKFRNLNRSNAILFEEKILNNIKGMYSSFSKNTASEFWDELEIHLGRELLLAIQAGRNDIENIIKNIIKRKRIDDCLISIKNKEYGFTKIKYNEKGSSEILYRNLIGHDTLLNYSLSMISMYPILNKVIIDSFPHIYIDEYQDTHTEVIQIMDSILSYSKKKKLPFLIGLFGDPVQSIYSNNENKTEIDNGVTIINKNINRRSNPNIVNLINKIRGNHQLIKQQPLKTELDGNVALSFKGKAEINEIDFILDRIENLKLEWNITSKNKLNCMVLKNKTIAQLYKFNNLYEFYSHIYTDKSSFLSYKSLNDETLSRDIVKLGRLQLAILNMAKPIFNIMNNGDMSISDIFSDSALESCSLKDVSSCLDDVRDNDYQSIYDAFHDLLVKSSQSNHINKLYSDLSKGFANNSDLTITNMEDITHYLLNLISDNPSEPLKENIYNVLNMDINEIYRWMSFVMNIEVDEEVNYLTCHSSKGLEFDNVLAVIDDSFGKDAKNNNERSKFTKLLLAGFDTVHDVDIESTRNLLYVICSRAIRNLDLVLLKNEDGEGAIDIL